MRATLCYMFLRFLAGRRIRSFVIPLPIAVTVRLNFYFLLIHTQFQSSLLFLDYRRI
ncbi:hypothetical protein RhiirC2_737282 [Rhizophagus irregularis]|uniref:Uncharacterized protein n=1 Tax=Rhizophagus irregularis TaxID=588596 RepID=A0A2N1NMS1_9GLOM|nr:hypothetical protein RhiirC2_737282 [Rhizophagus irregularis]